jgi:hypothetical protein
MTISVRARSTSPTDAAERLVAAWFDVVLRFRTTRNTGAMVAETVQTGRDKTMDGNGSLIFQGSGEGPIFKEEGEPAVDGSRNLKLIFCFGLLSRPITRARESS